MARDKKQQEEITHHILTPEQEELLGLYSKRLDSYFEELKASEKVQVEIETKHLKKILTK